MPADTADPLVKEWRAKLGGKGAIGKLKVKEAKETCEQMIDAGVPGLTRLNAVREM